MSVLASTVQLTSEDLQNGHKGRLFERFGRSLETVCQPVAARGDGEATWTVQVKNISSGGIGLVAVRRFEPGTGLAIEIPESGDYPGDTLLARIVRVKTLPDGEWFLGCAFISNLSDDTVDQVARLMECSGDESTDREELNGYHRNGHQQSKGCDADNIADVIWQNRDNGGRFLTRKLNLKDGWPIQRNKIVQLRIGKTPAEAPRLINAVVHSCLQQGKYWVVDYSLGNPQD